MNDETKLKLKKFGKRAGFGVALVSLFLLGVGVGACSARKAVGSSADDNAPSMAQPHRVAPPLSPSDFPTLDPSEDNLLKSAYAGHFAFEADNSAQLFTFTTAVDYDCYCLSLPAGLYRIEIDTSRLEWSGGYIQFNHDGWRQARAGFGAFPASGFTVSYGYCERSYLIGIVPSLSPFEKYIEVHSSYEYLCLMLYHGGSAKITLVDAGALPSTYDVSFPDNYNPLAGFGTPSDGLIGQLSGTSSSPFRLDLYFRSGGHIFKRIDFYFLPMQGTGYVSTLSSSGAPTVFTGSGFVYASMINYIDLEGTTFLAWRAIFGSTSDGTLYLRNYGEWASKQYQTINVIYYAPVLGQSGIAPNLDQIGILELRTASGVPTPVIGGDSNADVFSLLATGFNSVAGLMNIQILPFLTLGTLIFVPLVVMVIFAILKVLNK